MMTSPTPVRSILVATDLSPTSEAAVRSAADLAIASSAQLHVVHGYDEAWAISGDNRDLMTMQRQIHDKRGALLDLLDRLLPAGVALGSTRVEAGSPADIIVDEAARVEADIVVLGAHRNRGIADRYLGSTAERVIGRVKVPCLVVNGPLNLPLGKIIVPTDFSAPARGAIVAAFRIGEVVCPEGSCEVTLAHVVDGAGDSDTDSWREQEITRELRGAARDARAEAGSAMQYDAAVLTDDSPGDALLRLAQGSGAGLIVMGTHGDSILVRALLSSVSSDLVRRSTIPMLLVPAVATTPAASDEQTGSDAISPTLPI